MIDIKSVIAESLQNLGESIKQVKMTDFVRGKDVHIYTTKADLLQYVWVTVGDETGLWRAGADHDEVREIEAHIKRLAKSVQLTKFSEERHTANISLLREGLDEGIAISGVSDHRVKLNKGRFGKAVIDDDGKELPNSIVFTKEGGVAYIHRTGSVCVEVPDIMDRGAIGFDMSVAEFRTLKKLL